MDNID